jgi:hypothetical protein
VVVAGAVEDSGNANAALRRTKVDHVAAQGKAAVLSGGEFCSEFAHFRLRRQHLACRHDGIEERIGTLLAAALPSDVQTDFDQVVIGRRGDFEVGHPLHQVLRCLQPGMNPCLDRFDVERDALAAFKLLDSYIHVMHELFAIPQEFDRPVEGFAPIMINSEQDNALDELLIFRRKTGAHGSSPMWTFSNQV